MSEGREGGTLQGPSPVVKLQKGDARVRQKEEVKTPISEKKRGVTLSNIRLNSESEACHVRIQRHLLSHTREMQMGGGENGGFF